MSALLAVSSNEVQPKLPLQTEFEILKKEWNICSQTNLSTLQKTINELSDSISQVNVRYSLAYDTIVDNLDLSLAQKESRITDLRKQLANDKESYRKKVISLGNQISRIQKIHQQVTDLISSRAALIKPNPIVDEILRNLTPRTKATISEVTKIAEQHVKELTEMNLFFEPKPFAEIISSFNSRVLRSFNIVFDFSMSEHAQRRPALARIEQEIERQMSLLSAGFTGVIF